MQEVSGSIPLFSTKKALYFVGSMVLFFFAEADFWGLHCFACTVFKKECLLPSFSAGCCIIPFNVRRKVEIESNVELIPTINIYPADKLIDDHFLCFKTGTVVEIGKRNQFFVPLCRLSHNNASNKKAQQ